MLLTFTNTYANVSPTADKTIRSIYELSDELKNGNWSICDKGSF